MTDDDLSGQWKPKRQPDPYRVMVAKFMFGQMMLATFDAEMVFDLSLERGDKRRAELAAENKR